MKTNRINRLREQSLSAINALSAERAELVTEFYRDMIEISDTVPLQRAKSFYHVMNRKTICINDGELIVGERGPAPKATPTYPEICLHTLEDLEVLHSRQKVNFKVSEEMRQIYEASIIPFWTGKTNRDRVMSALPNDWKDAYSAGIFTEFMEQRAPGHTVAGQKLYQTGMNDLITACKKKQKDLNSASPDYIEMYGQLEAMKTSAKAIVRFAERHAIALMAMADTELDAVRKEELMAMAKICQRVPANAPQTFHEALQHYWFIHVGVITEVNPWDSFNPGRLDQNLWPYFSADLVQGTLTIQQATELLQCFWIKFNNHPSPPKVGITAQESSTYTDFSLINLGGLTPEGNDGTNDLTYLILSVIKEMRLLQPSSMVQVSHKNPDKLILDTLDILKTGFGQPSVFNTDAIIKELMNQGKSRVDATNGGASGCVEAGAFGTEAYFLTGYFNLPKIVEITLNNGFDPVQGKMLGMQSGDPLQFKTMDDFRAAFVKQLNHFVEIKLRGNDIIEKVFMDYMPTPFLSLFIEDCIENAKDYGRGGARYNTSYIQGVGIGTVTDCFSAIKYHVFDKQSVTMHKLLHSLHENFNGQGQLQAILIYQTPKYGNDLSYADVEAKFVFDAFFAAVDGHITPRGAVTHVDMLPTTCHIYFGKVLGATPDGRIAGMPVSEGISPAQGADTQGPSAVIKSALSFDHLKTGGTLLNQKFTPGYFSHPKADESVKDLIRTYFSNYGHHIQLNVVNADTLRKAQKNPELYRDLIVRVAGYSDYFNDLGESLQEEIILRTEHESI